jgi:hypothetical protein
MRRDSNSRKGQQERETQRHKERKRGGTKRERERKTEKERERALAREMHREKETTAGLKWIAAILPFAVMHSALSGTLLGRSSISWSS